MSKLTKALTAAAGNAGAGALYVEDVFSTYLYTGTGVAITIDNGIDLAGKGGLVWLKNRGTASNHSLHDTERTPSYQLSSNSTDAENTLYGDLTSFNSDGFSIGITGGGNNRTGNIASWTFRKAEKFFDVVTYTGDGASSRTIAHSLGSVPGCMIVKSSSNISGWRTYHASLGATRYVQLQTTAAAATYNIWNDTTPTDSVFSISTDVNANGVTYVAYLFASDAGGFGDDGSESIIKCGSFTGTAGTDVVVDVGFEPQWVLIKRATNDAGNWYLLDTMRGLGGSLGVNTALLYAENAFAENAAYNDIASVTPNGFTVGDGSILYAGPSDYIYIAIRRPMKTPESGAEVFNPDYAWNTNNDIYGYLGKPADLSFNGYLNGGSLNAVVRSRLTGGNRMSTNSTAAEVTDTSNYWDNELGFGWPFGGGSPSTDYITWNFKRATGFMDVVVAPASNPAVANAHNLGVVPELTIIRRTVFTGNNWSVGTNFTATTLTSKYLNSANVNGGVGVNYTDNWNLLGAEPTASSFTMTNQSDGPFVCYLFATLAGVSKVGSYTGTGSNVDVDCGFSAGARFVLITRVDSTGDWYVWDSARGIVAGNDPYLLLNSTAAEVTSTDYIDPLASGFTVTSSAPAALNASGGSYIFLAIA